MPYQVGLQTRYFEDPSRPNWREAGARPLLCDIWYPATPATIATDQFIGPPDTPLFWAGRAARDAALIEHPATLPLILVSHGTGGSTQQLGWLACHLAAQGYIVAGVNHHGNNALEPYLAEGFVRIWERPRDLTALLDYLLVDELFGPCLDLNRIGAAGFSLGGYTVLALAGAQLDFNQPGNRERNLIEEMPPEFPDPAALVALFEKIATTDTAHSQSYRDPRVRAVFAIAPALGEDCSPASLAAITIPVSLVVGEADHAAPAATNAAVFARHIPNATLQILGDGVAHYTFLAEGTPQGQAILPDLTVDGPGVDRAAVHQQVSTTAGQFFAATLG